MLECSDFAMSSPLLVSVVKTAIYLVPIYIAEGLMIILVCRSV